MSNVAEYEMLNSAEIAQGAAVLTVQHDTLVDAAAFAMVEDVPCDWYRERAADLQTADFGIESQALLED